LLANAETIAQLDAPKLNSYKQELKRVARQMLSVQDDKP
jgi:hypothetical protein